MEDKSGKYQELIDAHMQCIKDEVSRYRESIKDKYTEKYLEEKVGKKYEELERVESVYTYSLNELMNRDKGSFEYQLHGPDMWFDSTTENINMRREALQDFTVIARLNGVRVTSNERRHTYSDCMEGRITITVCDVTIH